MLSFGRLSKHNRSQHALPEQLSTGTTSGTAQAQQQQQQQQEEEEQGGAGFGRVGGAGLGGLANGSAAHANSSAEALPQSTLSSTNTAVSSSDHKTFLDARPSPQGQHQLQHKQHQQQHLHQHQQPPPPPPSPPHLFSQSGGVNLPLSLQTSGFRGSSSFDGHQQQTPIDFDPADRRSQSQRYGAPLSSQQQQQQQQAYGIASGSIDDLPSTTAHHQQQQQQQPPLQQQSAPAPAPAPAPAAQKRSTRKLIKGIFGSSRESHDNHHHQQQQPQPQITGHNPTGPYDNTAGLARRPSKRDPRILVNQNSASPYDQQVYQPPNHPPSSLQQPQPQPLQRRGTIDIQEQQAQSESLQQQASNYDQQPRHQLQQHFHYPANPPHQSAGEPHIVTSQLKSNQQLQNAETISQLSQDSSVTDSDHRSAFSQHQLPQAQGTFHGSTPSQDTPANSSTSQGASLQDQDLGEMAPPAPGGGPQSSRRAQDAEKGLRGQVDAPPGPPPGYHRQGSISLNAMSPAPPPGQGIDQGRNSPQPSDRDTELEKQFKDLLTKYKNVKRLYFDGKSQIEQLGGQVEHLQNAVANQRMSQSRTAWDDSEYLTRFNRLSGAINNLSFNIRKDWRSLPTWVVSFASADALKTGKQEMTAVGRAIVSRWLVEEFFNRCFHPALDTLLSAQLKEIEMSIRGNSYTMHSQEEFDALTTKVVNWRMATLDGLQKKLGSAEAAENRGMLTNKITTNLTAYLHQFLSTPPPPGVEGSTSMIAELAVAIAGNLPLESRDVAIMYPLPGDTVQTNIMEVEKTGLPPLEGHKEVGGGDSESDEDSDEKKDKIGLSRDASKVRFAGFVALEVRGRQVLAKAPVWTL
ncbi:hypothetical protein C2857_001442 [Epichloe festucae Fl1]|uniref:S-adenosylmethionine-dependent methyltransferase-like protein n=1 Tax=Epichloe festucae (strain Fl1) TaxID=877507 RepID=A0A7U3Q1P0_EPIFF|nr:hypothetical protein C2857_001442 [Epichloe festucae Fl1]